MSERIRLIDALRVFLLTGDRQGALREECGLSFH
jgi:hypothetical protein